MVTQSSVMISQVLPSRTVGASGMGPLNSDSDKYVLPSDGFWDCGGAGAGAAARATDKGCLQVVKTLEWLSLLLPAEYCQLGQSDVTTRHNPYIGYFYGMKEQGSPLKAASCTRLTSKQPDKLGWVCRGNRAHELTLDCTHTLPKSPASPDTSKSHIVSWMIPTETIIFFDWDDTLCPTSAIKDDPALDASPYFDMNAWASGLGELPWECPLIHEALWQHAETVGALLRQAASLGTVVIVTAALRGWVDATIQNFMPSLCGLLEELGIEVKYANECMPVSRLFAANKDDGADLPKLMKKKAMSQALKQFYGRSRKSRSWKNIINVGDSEAELNAMTDLVLGHRQLDNKGNAKRFRSKSVKLDKSPTYELLTMELQVLQAWLFQMVNRDSDFFIDLSSPEEAVFDFGPGLAS